MQDAPRFASTPIVAIGASAGGLTALEMLFEQLPAKTGAAFVVIQHLSPDYQSHMPELLGRRTKMPTVQMTDPVIPEANRVYLLPPGKQAELVEGTLQLFDRERERESDGELNLPIDRFFYSLAEQAIGETSRKIAAVVLSGTGSDGSNGIVEVNMSGGIVMCQDEDSAQFNGMPLNAIKTGVVHIVGPVPELAESLSLYLGGDSIDEVVAHTSPAIERNELDLVYERLEGSCGVDFGQYKHGTFSRRLSRRMMMSKIDQLDQYIDKLDSDPAEVSRLADDLMIGVTRFFRDPDGYTRLRKRCISKIVESKAAGDELRAWVAGCATGPEAYSVAMLIHDEVRKNGVDITVKIFATDVHPDAIRFAQRGLYPPESLIEIPKDLRERYVNGHTDGFEIDQDVRNSIVFARHDVLRDAPFTNLDLVTCRNLLIYLVDEAQARVLGAFAHALRSRGVLWLGPSETPGDLADDFTPLDKHWRLFQKERDSHMPLDLKLRKRPPTNVGMSIRPRSTRAPSAALVNSYDVLLSQYAPNGVLVDDSLQALQVFGDISDYTVAMRGRLSGTIEDMLVESLGMPLTILMQRMKLNQRNAESEQAIVEGSSVEIRVKAIPHRNLSETHYFISFHRDGSVGQKVLASPVRETREPETVDRHRDTDTVTASPSATNVPMLTERIRMLELELDFTRENLQATIEEVETTNEELQSSNEELTSSNEELQSTNEELHSVNEELHTTNSESSRRLNVLTELTTDLENVMRESDIGIVLVDNENNIRRITPAAADILRIRRHDVDGQPLATYTHAFEDVELIEVVKQANQEGRSIEMETIDGRRDPILLRVTPYQNGSGTLLTMTNLRSVKETSERLRKLTSIVEDSTDAIIGVELSGRISSWNNGATRLFGNDVDVDRNVELGDVIPTVVWGHCEELIKELAKKGEVAAKEIYVKFNGRKINLLIRVTPVLDEYDRVSSAAITFYDVTVMRVAEEQLNLRTRAIDAASNGFVIVDAQAKDTPIVYANQGFFNLTGFAPEEIVGRNCRFLQGPLTDPSNVDMIRDAIKKKKECRVTLLNYRRDGSQFHNDLIITPIQDSQGVVTHFVGVQNDATDIVEARRTLEASELEYRSTFENAAIGMAHIGMNGEWLRVNEKLCSIVGYPSEELKTKTFQDITHPEDLDKDLVQFAQMKRGETPGYSMEKRYIHRDGHVIWINLTTSLRCNRDGSPECCISLIEDITARKETEQKLSASRAIITEVIQQSDDPFVSFDETGEIQVANRSAGQLTALTGDLTGRSHKELFAGESEAPLIAAIDRVRRSQRGELTEFFSRFLNRWYDARVFPVEGGAAVYMTDVTGRKETEAYLERARFAAEEANKAKSKFLTNMSHEIRSPMTAILGFSDIALRDVRDGKSVDPANLETVIRNGRFLLRIINDILDLSKVEAGKLEVRKTRFKLLPMLTDIKELMRHRSKSSGVPLSFEFASPVPERLHSDRSRLEQILANLIGNALKFSPNGDVKVLVDVDEDTGSDLRFRVIDTGIGISEQNLSRLFQTFSQVHDNKAVGVEGTGLGLVISKRLAKLLGGDITVQSTEGVGSCFTLLLPFDESANRIEASASDLSVKRTVQKEVQQISARVLIADDARDVRLVTSRFLSRAGADIVEVVNGAEAVRAVHDAESERRPFDIILMDMQMPELDGREATQRIRDEGFTMPVIALTAGATPEEVDEALAAGCTQFIAKPVDAPDLISRVAKLLKGEQ
ncbi:PAS domain S-box protein [Rhodopirellula baltica]|uniref:Signal transduction histidine kinase with CheB and CheR activity n=1 Tax=Rhodopirellula baltica SWK14 TaxID=993516 RepID=L7C999_RHOBT|nr:PAS domain S-box protein [Rhodopirellula baltica]ELP29686.1 signal transduction histidine kinase with CheB and CheR activity [Rhodopirellula baltica SWK14]